MFRKAQLSNYFQDIISGYYVIIWDDHNDLANYAQNKMILLIDTYPWSDLHADLLELVTLSIKCIFGDVKTTFIVSNSV